VLILRARKHAEFSPRLVPPTLFAAAGASIGWFVSSEMGTTAIGGLSGALLAGVVYLLALWIWRRSHLLDSFRLSARGIREVVKRPALNGQANAGEV